MGTIGDRGHCERQVDLLTDDFTAVTHDRRGSGRSPRPPGWAATSAEKQPDDAAALLKTLGLGPATRLLLRPSDARPTCTAARSTSKPRL